MYRPLVGKGFFENLYLGESGIVAKTGHAVTFTAGMLAVVVDPAASFTNETYCSGCISKLAVEA